MNIAADMSLVVPRPLFKEIESKNSVLEGLKNYILEGKTKISELTRKNVHKLTKNSFRAIILPDRSLYCVIYQYNGIVYMTDSFNRLYIINFEGSKSFKKIVGYLSNKIFNVIYVDGMIPENRHIRNFKMYTETSLENFF